VTRLQVRRLSCRRGGRAILADVDFEAGGGEFIAVIGPNGAGKSTLLSALAGLLPRAAGEVLLGGADVASMPAARLARQRAYLPQNPRCDWPIPVERLVALGLTPTLPAFGGLGADDEARVTEALRACDLLAQRLQAATTLSGGELARAMLARALVGDPLVLIVDEPLSGLDPRHAIDTARRLRALAVEQGRLVIAAMHDLTLALRQATRVLALGGGRLCADGPPQVAVDDALLLRLFEVDGRVRADAGGPWVDFG
jgi:iron complex transport system ATP-binding protein